jgi:iron complex transport system permease protein
MSRIRLYIILAVILLSVSIFLGAGIGAVRISLAKMLDIILSSIDHQTRTSFSEVEAGILMQVRLPRVLMAALIGAGLASAGAAMQGIFRNPLVDASLIGISSGASLFASIFILFGSYFTWFHGMAVDFSMAIFSFLGASLTALLVIRISYQYGKLNSTTLILGGVALNAIAGALTGVLIYLADEQELKNLTFWTLGSFGGASWQKFMVLLPLVLIPILLIQRRAFELNAFALGEQAASYMGVSVKKTKLIVVLAATCMVGSSVSFVGVIGFIGLVIPHLVRFVVGPDHKFVLLFSALTGATLLTLSDLISRTILAPTEIPIGIVTALLGSPFFLFLVMKNKKELST